MNDVSCWESRSMDCCWSHKNWKKKRPSEDRDGQDCSVRWRRELLLLHSPLKTRLLPDGGAKHRTNITELHWPGSWLRIYGVNSPLVTLKCSTALSSVHLSEPGHFSYWTALKTTLEIWWSATLIPQKSGCNHSGTNCVYWRVLPVRCSVGL